ncbi:MAG TPA: GNAT family N-acetyltransferase [Cellvibrio sp.]|nr:GNAT family N-acetyltransferase [Cellvibrio sp.]
MSCARLAAVGNLSTFYESTQPMQISFLASLEEISASRWNALCPPDYPFVRHEFLFALEASQSAHSAQGWQPQHLIVERQGELVAALPLYLKLHSYGEYVFDWSWADAYKRYGISYYPKLVSAIPFTPCTGPRLLVAAGYSLTELVPLIVEAIRNRATELQASGWHCLFPDTELSTQLSTTANVQRIGCQFHWFNRNYRDWDGFVATMNSRKRKNINKERRSVSAQGISFKVKQGEAISREDWLLFYQLYCNTYLKRSGHRGYLTEQFFTLLSEQCPQLLVMISAQKQDTTIAASLFFQDANTLYGRYWGCLEEYNLLHFETCYYQGIEYAIKHRLQRFDGGAQGEHKIQRGFEPVITYSNHWLVRDDFHRAVADFVRQEAEATYAYQQEARQALPFKEPSFVE